MPSHMFARRLGLLLLAIAFLATTVPAPASAGTLGQGCQSGALFSSIECRIASLLAWAKGSGPPVTVAQKLQRLLLKANAKVTSANLLAGKHRLKPARARLAKADRNLAKVSNILAAAQQTVRTRGLPPTATVAEAAAFCTQIRTDLTTVRATLNPLGPVVFQEICCLRVCVPTQLAPSPCAVTEVIPCTSNDCILTASCLTTGCDIYPAPLGTFCQDIFANECTASPTCDAFNPTCVAPGP